MPPTIFPDVNGLGYGTVDQAIPTIDETSGDPVGQPFEEHPLGHHGYIGHALTSRKLAFSFGFFFLLLAGLGVRAGYLDLAKGGDYRRRAEGNRLRIAAVPSERGVVYDRNGTLLVRNVPDFTLTLTPADIPREIEAREQLIVQVAEAVGLTPVDVENGLRNYPANLASPVPIKEHLDYEQALKLDIQSGRMTGVSLANGMKREVLLRPEGVKEPVLSLSHVIGYEGRVNEAEYAKLKSSGYLPTDAIGKTGIEAFYEQALRGTYGKKQIEVDAFGREQKVLATDEPVQGKDITLTIDARLQAAAETALKNSAARNGVGRGSVVAMDPRNGEILALVSWPAYDANSFARGISNKEYQSLLQDANQPLFSRAVSGAFPPGSTVKTVVAAAALAEGVVSPSTTVLSTGGIHFGAWFFPDWKPGGHGTTNVTKAIAESVNTFFYAVGGGWDHIEGLGIERLASWYRKFNIGSKLGIDLPNEASGFVPNSAWKERVKEEAWYIGDTYHVAIGQGDMTATPLQVAAWTSVFANGGSIVQPHVVKQIRSNKTIEKREPQPISKDVVSQNVVEIVRHGMRQTVLAGSAQGLKNSFVEIAGKTGTAQWSSKKPTHAWFAGFAPYNDPEIVVVVLVEAGGEGFRASAPVARDIIEAWLRPKNAAEERSQPSPANIDGAPSSGLY